MQTITQIKLNYLTENGWSNELGIMPFAKNVAALTELQMKSLIERQEIMILHEVTNIDTGEVRTQEILVRLA